MSFFPLQPTLSSEFVKIVPLKADDFETLYKVASDPEIWEQHPNKDRYKREVFKTFFEGAMESGGAFLVYDNRSNDVIGSSRFYGFDKEKDSVTIGYTFLAKDHWGSTYNHALKKLMLEHAFKYVSKVMFHIGAVNIRSQKAIEKLGAKKVDELDVAYYGEASKLNFIYKIEKKSWENG